jgi:hypothetical protein
VDESDRPTQSRPTEFKKGLNREFEVSLGVSIDGSEADVRDRPQRVDTGKIDPPAGRKWRDGCVAVSNRYTESEPSRHGGEAVLIYCEGIN